MVRILILISQLKTFSVSFSKNNEKDKCVYWNTIYMTYRGWTRKKFKSGSVQIILM